MPVAANQSKWCICASGLPAVSPCRDAARLVGKISSPQCEILISELVTARTPADFASKSDGPSVFTALGRNVRRLKLITLAVSHAAVASGHIALRLLNLLYRHMLQPSKSYLLAFPFESAVSASRLS